MASIRLHTAVGDVAAGGVEVERSKGGGHRMGLMTAQTSPSTSTSPELGLARYATI